MDRTDFINALISDGENYSQSDMNEQIEKMTDAICVKLTNSLNAKLTEVNNELSEVKNTLNNLGKGDNNNGFNSENEQGNDKKRTVGDEQVTENNNS